MQKLAKAKFPISMFNLALQLFKGEFIPMNPNEGFGLLEQLVCRVDMAQDLRALALTAFGHSLLEGRGCTEDPTRALEYFRLGAQMGNADAAFNAGIMLAGRTGHLATNNDHAARYYAMGMDMGDVRCQTNLGCLHMLGVIRGADFKYGQQLLLKSRQDGDQAASKALIQIEALAADGNQA